MNIRFLSYKLQIFPLYHLILPTTHLAKFLKFYEGKYFLLCVSVMLSSLADIEN